MARRRKIKPSVNVVRGMGIVMRSEVPGAIAEGIDRVILKTTLEPVSVALALSTISTSAQLKVTGPLHFTNGGVPADEVTHAVDLEQSEPGSPGTQVFEKELSRRPTGESRNPATIKTVLTASTTAFEPWTLRTKVSCVAK